MMRSLFIAAALLVPIVFIIALSDKTKPAPAIYHNNKKLEEITSKVKPPPKADNRLPRKLRIGSLEEEKLRLKKRLAELEKMTETEWLAERESRRAFGSKWDKLSDKQKLEAIRKLNEKKAAQNMGRAPEIELEPAKPISN